MYAWNLIYGELNLYQVISIAGVYRSGKSFILNQLAGYKDGFNIGSTVERMVTKYLLLTFKTLLFSSPLIILSAACTQGIWMWIVEDNAQPRGPENCRYLLLDTEVHAFIPCGKLTVYW